MILVRPLKALPDWELVESVAIQVVGTNVRRGHWNIQQVTIWASADGNGPIMTVG
jgi:hypothetical protein